MNNNSSLRPFGANVWGVLIQLHSVLIICNGHPHWVIRWPVQYHVNIRRRCHCGHCLWLWLWDSLVHFCGSCFYVHWFFVWVFLVSWFFQYKPTHMNSVYHVGHMMTLLMGNFLPVSAKSLWVRKLIFTVHSYHNDNCHCEEVRSVSGWFDWMVWFMTGSTRARRRHMWPAGSTLSRSGLRQHFGFLKCPINMLIVIEVKTILNTSQSLSPRSEV